MSKRVAIYSRVSTERQTVANQVTELRAWAERCGHTVVAEYEDHAISGAKGRGQRPAFDRMLKGAVRREFDVIAVWSSDRLGRSLPHLIEVLQTIRDTRAGLYIHTQALDTTTPAGRAMFGMLAVFGFRLRRAPGPQNKPDQSYALSPKSVAAICAQAGNT